MDASSRGGPSAAAQTNSIDLENGIRSSSPTALLSTASAPSLTQDLALSLLQRTDLTAECLIALSKNSSISKYRKVRLAIVAHTHTPRHVSLPMLRLLYTLDLMQVALTPVVAADIKRAAEETLAGRLDTISTGEKLTLARRASGRIAAKLLLDNEARVMQAALDNPRLTEAAVARIVAGSQATSAMIASICHHSKWSLVREVRVALLRNEKTPLARALEFAQSLPARCLREILQNSRLPESTKTCLLGQCCAPRGAGGRAAGFSE